MNPEFRRNLLLELTLHRLLAMPAVLLLIFALAGMTGDYSTVATAAQNIMRAMLLLWGTRLAADSILGEVAARTWDGQRMSALGPFAIGWGKLLGSTIYIWYGTAICIPALFYDGQRGMGDLARIVMSGLFAQGAAMFLSLLLLRLRSTNTRFQVTQSHMIGIIAGSVWWSLATLGVNSIVWYGLTYPYSVFAFATGLIFLAWLGVGLYRLLREELQFRVWPLGLPAFVIFTAVFVGGFKLGASELTRFESVLLQPRILVTFLVVVAVVWIAAFSAPKGYVRLQRWREAVASANWRVIARATPSWVIGMAFVMLFAGVGSVMYGWTPDELLQQGSLGAFMTAVTLFLVRDIGIMHLTTLDGRIRRGHLTALIYLAILYVPIPLLLRSIEQTAYMPLLLPVGVDSPILGIVAPLVEVAIVGGILAWRWRVVANRIESR